MKWNDYLLEMRLILISNYLTNFTQNLSDNLEQELYKLS